MISLLLMSAAVTAAQPFTFESAGHARDRQILRQALNAPERTRADNTVRYCVKVEGDPARDQVCRSKADWRRLGLEPLHG